MITLLDHIFLIVRSQVPYNDFLQNTVTAFTRCWPTRRRLWMQQDGAPHYTRNVRNTLKMFPNRWIGKGGLVSWPPRSSDLTSLEFFFGVTWKVSCIKSSLQLLTIWEHE